MYYQRKVNRALVNTCLFFRFSFSVLPFLFIFLLHLFLLLNPFLSFALASLFLLTYQALLLIAMPASKWRLLNIYNICISVKFQKSLFFGSVGGCIYFEWVGFGFRSPSLWCGRGKNSPGAATAAAAVVVLVS